MHNLYNNLRIVIVTLILFTVSGLWADTLILKNGQTIIGRIVNQTQTTIDIDTDNGRKSIQKSQIRRISYGDPAAEKAAEEKRKAAEAEKRKAEEDARRAAEEEARRQQEADKRKAEEEERLKKEQARKAEEESENKTPPQPAYLYFNAGFVRWSPSVMHNSFKLPYVNSYKDMLASNPRMSMEFYNKKQDGYGYEAGHSHQAGKWDHQYSIHYTGSTGDEVRKYEKSNLSINYIGPSGVLYGSTFKVTDSYQMIPEPKVREAKLRYETAYNPFRFREGSYLKDLAFTGGISLRGQDLNLNEFRYNDLQFLELYTSSSYPFSSYNNQTFPDYLVIRKIQYNEGFAELTAGIRYKYEFSPKAIFDIAGGISAGAGRFNYVNDQGPFTALDITDFFNGKVMFSGTIKSEGSYLSSGYGFRIKDNTFRFFYLKSFIKTQITSAKRQEPNGESMRGFYTGNQLIEFINLPQTLPGTLQEENKIGFEYRYQYN